MQLDRKTVRTIAGLVAFAVVLNAAVRNLAAVGSAVNWTLGILSPLLIGLALAFLLNIPMSILERRVLKPHGKRALKLQRKLKRPLAMLLSVLFVLLIVTLVSVIVLPQLIDAVTRVFAQVPGWVEHLQTQVQRFAADAPELVAWIESLNFNWTGMQAEIVTFLRRGLGPTLSSVASMASSVFGTATSAAIAFIFALSVLAAKEKLTRQTTRALRAFLKPERAERIIGICRITSRAFSGFITGQLTEACILGTLCFLGMTLFQFPNTLLISTLVGVGAIVPIFGAFVSATLGALLVAAAEGVARGLWFALFFVVLQQLEGNLIYPRVMGKRLGLPAIWVLAAITIGSGILGVLGMLLCIPIFAVAYTLLREAVGERAARKKRQTGGKHGDGVDQVEGDPP